MTKIAIISQPEQGVLIDVGGCSTLHEATQHLTSTLQVQSQFWENQSVDLNIGPLALTADDLAQVLAIFSEVGVKPRYYFAESRVTQAALDAHNLKCADFSPATLEMPQAEETSGSASPADGRTDPATVDGAEEAAAAEASGPAEGSSEADSTTSGAEEKPAAPAVPHILYLRQTLRSGQAVSHKGHLVIIGDVNPGAEVMAEGDITIWGALRGVAHAGIAGNTSAEIRALRFEPIQLRIAHAIARSPDRKPGAPRSNGPETARIVNGTIRIASSAPE